VIAASAASEQQVIKDNRYSLPHLRRKNHGAPKMGFDDLIRFLKML